MHGGIAWDLLLRSGKCEESLQDRSDGRADGARLGGAAPDPPPVPRLQVAKEPELVVPALGASLDQGADSLRVNDPVRREIALFQRFERRLAPLAADPSLERRREAGLRPGHHGLGEPRSDRLAE